MTGTPCPAPCWQGITPGVTNEATVRAVISNPDLVKQDSIQYEINPTDPSVTTYTFRVSDDSTSIHLKNGTVYLIGLARGPTLQEIIAAFGPPDMVYAVRRANPHSPYDYYEAHFFYPKKGIWLYGSECADQCNASFFSTNGDVYVRFDMGIHAIFLFQPRSTLDIALTESLFLNPWEAEQIVTNATSWAGTEHYYFSTQGYGPRP